MRRAMTQCCINFIIVVVQNGAKQENSQVFNTRQDAPKKCVNIVFLEDIGERHRPCCCWRKKKECKNKNARRA
jgi:hypothetical protein